LNAGILKRHAKLRQIELSVHHAALKRNAAYEKCKEIKIANMNMAELSFAVSCNRIRSASLPYDFIRYFFPLFENSYGAFLSTVTYLLNNNCGEDSTVFEWIESSINDIENFWSALESSNLNLIILCASNLSRFSPKRNAFFLGNSSVVEMFANIMQLEGSLSLKLIHSTSSLWKNSNVATIRDIDLWNCAHVYSVIDNEMNHWNKSPLKWFSLPHIYSLETTRTAITQGISTLYYINDQIKIDAPLFESINAIPGQLLKASDKLLVISEDLSSLQTAQCKLSKIMLWPINDSLVLFKEMHIIIQLLGGMNSAKTFDLGSVLMSLKDILTFIMSSSFSPLHFEPIQRLLWALDQKHKTDTTDKSHIIEDIKPIISHALLRWNEALWKNGHSFLNMCAKTEETHCFLDGSIMPLLFGDLNIDVITKL
jgi:hypothetical protein